eukprot:GDKI01040538.1.p1 GENE.GDKI01040538.1~~GDKI01040538.1.p1  ORF type:complete len:148 (+),score=39.64 GDKI01040538.1:50-445(+)
MYRGTNKLCDAFTFCNCAQLLAHAHTTHTRGRRDPRYILTITRMHAPKQINEGQKKQTRTHAHTRISAHIHAHCLARRMPVVYTIEHTCMHTPEQMHYKQTTTHSTHTYKHPCTHTKTLHALACHVQHARL